MTLAKSKKMCVMEFGPDHSMDMFQIGRSTDSAIDMVVVDTVEFEGKKVFNSSSAISRYACRILCEREPPYTARIYAAAFDINRKIQLSANAPSWSDGSTGSMDGLTTNGITILRPVGVFEAGVDPGQWLEVTVMGNIRQMRPSRSAREPGPSIPAETNVLTDGCLIDLCGITLMWRTAFGLDNGPSSTLLRERQQELNLLTPQCLVNFLTLHFKGGHLVTSPTSVPHDDDLREPWMYVNCGHVFGKHDWKWTDNETDTHRTCPICHKAGPYIKLELGNERAFFIDEGSFTHTFAPCGHVTTEQTARYSEFTNQHTRDPCNMQLFK
jgi:pellino protein